MVNAFTYDDAAIAALRAAFSDERLGTYVAMAGGDYAAACRLHVRNTALSAALYGAIQTLELAMRNAMHRELARAYGPYWYENLGQVLTEQAKAQVEEARTSLRRTNTVIDPPHVVAALSFGFWASLLGKGRPNERLNSYTNKLWLPALHRAFAPVGASVPRKAVEVPIQHLRTLRNRIAHHEPIIGRNLQADYQSILALLGRIDPQVAGWLHHHSRFADVLAGGEATLRF